MEHKEENRSGIIREVNTNSDLGAVADLIELCFKDTIDEDGLDYIRYLRRLSTNKEDSLFGINNSQNALAAIQGFVYEVNGKIVGNLSMIPFQKGADFVYLVANVAVHPDYRRQRIGFDLTAKALRRAKEKSARSVWLQVRDDNPPAINLYKQMGFIERSRRSTYTFNSRNRIKIPQNNRIKISSRKSEEWIKQKELLAEVYPPDVRWNLGLQDSRLLPGFWQSLVRFFSGISIANISVYQENQLLGFGSLERTALYADNLWIACQEKNDHAVIQAVILQFVNNSFYFRPLTVNFPQNRGEHLFEALGFKKNHTLIWMEEILDSSGISLE